MKLARLWDFKPHKWDIDKTFNKFLFVQPKTQEVWQYNQQFAKISHFFQHFEQAKMLTTQTKVHIFGVLRSLCENCLFWNKEFLQSVDFCLGYYVICLAVRGYIWQKSTFL